MALYLYASTSFQASAVPKFVSIRATYAMKSKLEFKESRNLYKDRSFNANSKVKRNTVECKDILMSERVKQRIAPYMYERHKMGDS